MNNDIQRLAANLGDSIRHYRRIFDLLEQMDREIGTTSELRARDMATSLSELQGQAQAMDVSLQLGLNEEAVASDVLRPLLTERQEIIGESILLNAKIRKKAKGVQSLLAHELGMLRHGQTALSGYKSQQNRGGRIVNSTS